MPLLLNLNQIKAAKKVVFGVCKEYMGVKKVAPPIQGFSVNLSSVVELIVREQRLHQLSSRALRLMMKLDGRPFWGKRFVIMHAVYTVLSFNYYCFFIKGHSLRMMIIHTLFSLCVSNQRNYDCEISLVL